ncbi:MAG: O-antigen ligase family protein [Oligoflexia bacterium]|nr:O-antigen ligase family protein [Oligoflexia bacterium]
METPTVSQSQIVEVSEIVEFAQPANAGLSSHTLVPATLRKITRTSFYLLLALSPLLFGSVHETVWPLWCTGIFALLAAYSIVCPAALSHAFQAGSPSRFALLCLLTWLAYCVAQSLAFSSLSISEYPLAQIGSLLVNRDGVVNALLLISSFIALFSIGVAYTRVHPSFVRNLINFICLVALTVSLIALGHWYYDNGRLFWYFEPDNVFTSDRARWPFVNSNHLGNFLLPLLMIALGRFTEVAREIFAELTSKRRPMRSALSVLSSGSHFQRKLASLGFYAISALASATAILASLSRASWIGLALAIGAFTLLLWATAPKDHGDSQALAQSGSGSRYRIQGRNSHVVLRIRDWGRPLLAIAAVTLILIFLNQRGGELFVDRLDYGLMYTKDDIRWQLYNDSIPMFWSHPLFGRGLAAWASYYPQFMHPLLGGINPVYLHSDPLQMLIELGIVGVLPLLVLILGLSRAVFSALKSNARPCLLAALFSGMLGMLFGAAFDFPLHIPVIGFYLAIYLTCVCFLLTSSEGIREDRRGQRG